MILTDIITTEDATQAQLARFKDYANITSTDHDDLLIEMLTRAMIMVQRVANKSLLACTMQVTDTEADGQVRLYETIGKIRSVTSDGAETTDYQIKGDVVEVAGTCVKVVYDTIVYRGNAAELMPLAYALASAIEAGDDANAKLNELFSRC